MSNYRSLRDIKVGLQFDNTNVQVGRLATRDHKTYFEYDPGFLQLDLNISPFRLVVEPGLKSFDPFLFEGLPGVFNDSLPDGWGRLLMDRFLKSQNLLPAEFSTLDRLANVGTTGLGALVYEPDYSEAQDKENVDLNLLAEQTQEVLGGQADEVLKELINLNGSSAGARPKALIAVDKLRSQILHGKHELPKGFDHWMVKFPNTTDGVDAGAIEHVYAIMAVKAGLNMTPTYLFPGVKGPGYFGIQRFDRSENHRFHIHTASGLLHSDFRTPSLDYENLIALTEALTKDVREVEKMFRLAAFNVLSHNRDDHGKNFSFLMDKNGEWKLSPAYDLTFSSGPRGHQSTMVMGEGESPTKDHLVQLGMLTHLTKKEVLQIIDQTLNALSNWHSLAKEYGVSETNIKLIQSKLML